MTGMKIFENPEFGKVRIDEDASGGLWFCGKDVCDALGYENNRKAINAHIDDTDVTKRYVGVVTGKCADGSDSIQNIQMTFVNESGLYSLIFGSKQERAKTFKKWVTSEVLPSIRKTGEYVAPAKKETDSKSLFQKMRVASWTAKFLNLNEASRLSMARMIAASVGMEDTLPTAVDAGTEHPTVHSATDQLKRFGVEMSACAFNKILLRKGVVKQESRQGSGGKVHHWMVLLPKYNQYGENQRDPQHQQQTSIKWYDNLFPRLLSEVGINYIKEEV